MVEIKAISYEQARKDFFELEMQKAQRRMKYWETRIDRTRPNNLMDVAHGKAADAGWEYNFYNDALEALENQPKWISVEERLPDVSDLVLVIANGQPRANIRLHNALLIASYWGDDGWIADGFDGWDKLIATHWQPLPEPPKEASHVENR